MSTPEAPDKNVIARRPAESTALGAAAALLIGKLAGLDDPETITALAIVIAALPTVVTYFVSNAQRRARPVA